MQIKSDLSIDLGGVTCSIEENYGLMKIKSDVFENLTDLQKDAKVLEWIDKVQEEKELTGILVLSEPECFGLNAYNKFLSEAAGKEFEVNQPGKITKFQKTQIRAIEINMLMTFIKRLINFPKLFIMGLDGEIVTPFIGITLVSDFRFISPSTRLSLSHVNYGLHPSGALPFLLPKFIGQGKAEEFLLRGGIINAEEMIHLGLASNIIREENFSQLCIEHAKQLFSIDGNVVKTAKDLLYHYKKELYLYFDQEANYLYS